MKKILTLSIVLISIVLAACSSSPNYTRESIDSLAKCLTEKGVVEYGAFWCQNCAKQKKKFGSSYKHLKYIECDPRGENEQSLLCIKKKVEKYPDWEFSDGSRLVGVQEFETLATKSGCPTPVKVQ
jgi:hypothetical protein